MSLDQKLKNVTEMCIREVIEAIGSAWTTADMRESIGRSVSIAVFTARIDTERNAGMCPLCQVLLGSMCFHGGQSINNQAQQAQQKTQLLP